MFSSFLFALIAFSTACPNIDWLVIILKTRHIFDEPSYKQFIQADDKLHRRRRLHYFENKQKAAEIIIDNV